MDAQSLPDLRAFDPVRLDAARRQMRSALLWPARIAASFCVRSTEQPSPALHWDAHRQAILTPVFDESLQVELRLPALELQFLEHGEPVPHTLDMDDHTPAHVEAWVLVELLHRNLDRDRFSKDLPFDIDDLMMGDHEEFSPHELGAEIAALTSWLAAGASVLGEIAQAQGVTVVAPSMSLTIGLPSGKSSRAGGGKRSAVFSLGDVSSAEPQFSVVRDPSGTVAPLRPDSVIPASVMQQAAMTPGAIARMLADGTTAGAA